ncbi:MAG: ATP-binding cassette domain-containing protein, partial [Candidatus Zixiibacteriota bacterium]
MYKLCADNISKRFGYRKVLSNIGFQLETGQSMAVVGPNGSGKST